MDGTAVIEFQGLLDRDALAALRAAAEPAAGAVRLVLKAGTEVDRACLAELRTIAAEIVAESPYLARWMADRPSTDALTAGSARNPAGRAG
jgi:hypothetical protein